MSALNLNPQQFHQLTMFERTRDVIEKVHKIDASDEERETLTPREQWEETGLADSKLEHGAMTGLDRGYAEGTIPPVRIQHSEPGEGAFGENVDKRLELWNGHHRLAMAEELGHQHIPVWHSFDPYEADTPGGGGGYQRVR